MLIKCNFTVSLESSLINSHVYKVSSSSALINYCVNFQSINIVSVFLGVSRYVVSNKHTYSAGDWFISE